MPQGQTWIYSDTLGVTTDRTGHVLIKEEAKLYPEVCRLLCQWLRDHLPEGLDQDFMWTSININKNYAGRIHRDRNNVGPSFIKAFGDFRNGALNYWPSDTGEASLEDLKEKDKMQVNIRDNLLLFDGNRGHFVQPFQGERYSLVFFSVRTWNKIPKSEMELAKKCGIPIPTEKSMNYVKSLLGVSRKDGYRVWSSPQQLLSKAAAKRLSNAETPRKSTKRKNSMTPSPPESKKRKTSKFTKSTSPHKTGK
jgi:hypothetical protein